MNIQLSKIAISYAMTTAAFLAGNKTVTRRRWKTKHCNKFRAGLVTRAINKDYRAGGQIIGYSLHVLDPYRELLSEITQDHFIREGGTEYWPDRQAYVDAMHDPKDPCITVVEFLPFDVEGKFIRTEQTERVAAMYGVAGGWIEHVESRLKGSILKEKGIMLQIVHWENILFSGKTSSGQKKQAYAEILNMVVKSWNERVTKLQGVLEGKLNEEGCP